MPATASKNKAPSKWRRRIKRALIGLAIAGPICLIGLWIAVHNIPWLGPAIADGLRKVIGVEAVSRLEDFAYGVEDRFNRFWRSDEAPQSHWEVPTTATQSSPDPAEPSAMPSVDAGPTLPPFKPADVGPMFKSMAAKGDGQWVAVTDPNRPQAPTSMYKTLIHPDAKRPWAELFVVAIDYRRLSLHLIAGAYEPKSLTPGSRGYERKAVVPAGDRERLVAAFNGGFKAAHGRWGMNIDGVTLIPGRKHGCTIVMFEDDKLLIDPWQKVQGSVGPMRWWRQTPPCMYHKGKRHGGLWDPKAKGWGAALEGDTVIRRSAMGLDASGELLLVSMSNHTSATVIADGMRHAGAVDIAQLDVNWSFPRFVMFPRDAGGQLRTTSLFEGFKVEPDEYLGRRAPRDFFYLLRRIQGS